MKIKKPGGETRQKTAQWRLIGNEPVVSAFPRLLQDFADLFTRLFISAHHA